MRPNLLTRQVAGRTRLIAWLKRRRRPGEKGLGDTLARLIGPPGKTWQKWYPRITGLPCGCANGQAYLNTHFPYLD
jgi:hypothetical protein